MTDDKPKTRPTAADAPPIWTVDKQWFVAKLERAERSMAALANHLGIDRSAVTNMLNGKRQIKMDEVEKIARFLNVAVDEVLTHAGIELAKHRQLKSKLSATIDGAGRLTNLAAPMEIPAELMARVQANVPIQDRGSVSVAQVRASDGPMSILDDAIVLYEPPVGINPAPKGVLSISRLTDGVTMIGHVEDARKTGEAKIRMPDGKLRDVQLAASGPLLVIIP